MPEAVEKLSRRRLLQNAAAVVGVASSGALAASCAPPPPTPVAQPAPPPPRPLVVKLTKAQALYQDFPHGRQRCELCLNFIAPADCQVIQGPVSPRGWCRNFRPKFPGGELG